MKPKWISIRRKWTKITIKKGQNKGKMDQNELKKAFKMRVKLTKKKLQVDCKPCKK